MKLRHGYNSDIQFLFGIPMSLPVAAVLDDILAALSAQQDLLLCAPTGAGKSTWLPLQLLASPQFDGGRILLLEPRRIAARAVATYLAQQLNQPVGETVGYRIRQENRVSANTRLEVVTEGVLTRMLQADPELTGYQLVIFDECHERSLHADLALALCLDMRDGLREDLQLLLMSATPDIAAYQRLLPEAATINSQGRSYPVTNHYRPQPPRSGIAGLIAVIAEACAAEQQGSILVFLPGAGEIRSVQSALQQDGRFAEFEILMLHGGLPFAQQKLALLPPSQRRITLATNVAETSLTLPDITTVVDAGRERFVRFQLKQGIEQLVTRRVSQASARQRAGRAGRLQAGCCYRLWAESEYVGLSEQLQPEIERSDLCGLLLECAAWGVTEPEQLRWLTPPPQAAWQQARQLLIGLQLCTANGQLTDNGRRVQQLGITPRLGAMLVAMRQESPQVVAMGCLVAALLSESDPLKPQTNCDLQLRLNWLEREAQQPQAKRIWQQAKRWFAQLRSAAWPKTIAPVSAYWLAQAFPDRIAMQRNLAGRSYLLSSGFGVELLPDATPLGAQVVVAQLSAGEQHASGIIRLALAFSASEWQAVVEQRGETALAVHWHAAQQRVVAEQQQRLGALLLGTRRSELPTGEQVEQLLLAQIVAQQLTPLPWSERSRSLWQRAELWSRLMATEPTLNQQQLLQDAELWLAPYLAGRVGFAELQQLDLYAMLSHYIGAEACHWIEQHLPSHFQTPLQRQVAIRYTDNGQAVVSLPMQEMYGFDRTVSLADGRLALAFELLSPAGRPIQLTTDLPGFWRGSYSEVCKEMKGRYPKHFWPDKPQQAEATRLTKRHLQL